MADIALKFVVEALVPIIQENWKLIAGAKEDSAQLVGELNRLKAFLEDAAKYRKANSVMWRNFVKEVQVMVYKAEGLTDKLLIDLAKQHNDKSSIEKSFDVKYVKSVRELAISVKDVLEHVKKIREDHPQAFQTKPMLDDQPTAQVVAQGPLDTLLEDNEVIGFDEEAQIMIKRLDEGTNDLDVIPVVGLPGLGKATLTIKVYKDPQISFKFFNRIWVYVGQQYKLNEVLLNILGGLTKITEEYKKMTVHELHKKIREIISKGGKCLIVLDDVWSTDIVDSVMNVFPENNKGHRIMITTLDGRIGRYANANPCSLKFLKVDESFQLLVNRVSSSNVRRCPEKLPAHGKSIAKQCSGVPLAVEVIAGALRGRTSQSKWEMVKANVGQHLINPDDPKSCLKFVEMSYGHLPKDMKACFLYCGAFPQGFEIPAWKLIRLWISEGLISSKLKASPENIAEQYLNDLVNRNLVMVMRKRANGQVKTCRLHDMLHQFCKMEAKYGGLFHEVCEKTDEPGLDIPDLDTSRRLCVQLSLLKAFISKEPFTEFVRSLLCFSTKQKGSEQLSNIHLLHKAFPLVRVLDVEPLIFKFSKDFQGRLHLRYIAISGNYDALPTFFGKFWNLQTLILNTEKSSIEIKADIWKMLRLRHLHTNSPATLPSPATTLTADEPSCLQTLSIVAPGSCRADVFARTCYLRKVTVHGQLADFFETNKGEFHNFKKLKCLEQLKLLNNFIGSKVLQLPPAFLGFLCKLKQLTLSNTGFAWSDANRLGQLEFLEVLKLKENAFIGTAWDSEVVVFSQLKVLLIKRAADFQTWKASNSSFQGLKCLVLISCEKLEAVPFELASVSSLQEMTLENTNKAIESGKAIQGRKKEIMQKAAESKSGTESQDFKFKLTIYPPETADCNATQ